MKRFCQASLTDILSAFLGSIIRPVAACASSKLTAVPESGHGLD